MSQLNVDTLKDRLGVDQPDIVGAAKAWVNFNGTGTVAIRDDFNVDSITDNGVGDYTVSFTSPMPDTNYTTNLVCNNQLSSPSNAVVSGIKVSANDVISGYLVGSVDITFKLSNSSGFVDRAYVAVTIHSN